MNAIKTALAENRRKVFLSMAALALGVTALILYLSTGIIPGFSARYSTGMIVALTVALLGNLFFSFKRVDTLEALPFVAYIISIFIFLASNADYLAAVIRAIDVTRVDTSFVITILLTLAAAVVYALSFVGNKNA